MTKGCKIWLWFLLITNILGIVLYLYMLSSNQIIKHMAIISIIMTVAAVAGIGLLLFQQKAEGFYIYLAVVVIDFIVSIATKVNIFVALFRLFFAPSITYYFLNKNGLAPFSLGNNISLFQNTTSLNNTYTTTIFTKTATQQAANTDSAGETKQAQQASKNTNFSAATSNCTQNTNIAVDLYKELEIDRSWDEKTIRQHLKNLQKIWIRRQGACNDKEQLLLIDKILNNVEDAFRYLTKESKRKRYDQELDAAYKAGMIVDEFEEKLVSLLDQARAYYRKGNIKLATKFAQEAVDGNINDPNAYEFLAQCYQSTGQVQLALNVVDKGSSIFTDNINLIWLGARIATDGMSDYDSAQQRINRLIEIAPDRALGYTEQVYMHLRKGEEQLAFKEIDAYIAAHPDDNEYKRGVAYDLDVYSNNCYYHDKATDSYFIADKNSYNKCLQLRTKACEIFKDEHTQERLERAKYYGQREFNDWNVDSIKGMAIYGTLFLLMGFLSEAFFTVAIIFYAIMGVLIYYSFRPYWQINKTYVTGQLGTIEKLVNQMGPYAVKGAKVLFQLIWKIVIAMIKFLWWLASGGLFK